MGIPGTLRSRSTPVYERTQFSTAGRSNSNNINLDVPGRPDFQLSTAHNTLLFMSTMCSHKSWVRSSHGVQRIRARCCGVYFQGFRHGGT